MTSAPTRTSVVVVGGGQAGLSVSYYLQRLGLDVGTGFVVLDRGPSTGGAWQHRWEALRIGVAHRINDLPGLDELGLSFETADRQRPARDVVAEYYAAYEAHYGLDVVRPASVTRVFDRGIDLVVEYTDAVGSTREITTQVVVNATGTWGSPFIPWYPGRNDFAGEQVDTSTYRSADDYAGRRVIVVGGGTSAIGFMMELEHVASELTWVSRRPIEFLDEGELNLEDGRRAVAMQDEAAREGRALPSIVSGTGVPRTRRIQSAMERGLLTHRPMFDRIEPAGVRWDAPTGAAGSAADTSSAEAPGGVNAGVPDAGGSLAGDASTPRIDPVAGMADAGGRIDGEFIEADVILWATGFRPELRHLAPLKLREKAGGVMVGNGSSWKDPRIFFAGYGPQASTVGANRAGRTIARQVMRQLSEA